jgi:hypothetical protein
MGLCSLDKPAGREWTISYLKRGQATWCPTAYLTQQEIQPVSALVHWQFGEKQPWCLAADLPDASWTLCYYRQCIGSKSCFQKARF